MTFTDIYVVFIQRSVFPQCALSALWEPPQTTDMHKAAFCTRQMVFALIAVKLNVAREGENKCWTVWSTVSHASLMGELPVDFVQKLKLQPSDDKFEH